MISNSSRRAMAMGHKLDHSHLQRVSLAVGCQSVVDQPKLGGDLLGRSGVEFRV